MTAREPDPVQTVKPCPRCAKPDAVHEATPYERDRTRCDWFCSACNLAFEGTATEFQRMQAKAMADAAERMATTPRPNESEQP